MKRFSILLACLPLLVGMGVLFSRTGGVGFVNNSDRTGGPVSQGTCGSAGCHSGGAFTPTITLTIRDSSNNVITEYRPNYVYSVTAQCSSTGAPAGYGFQAVALIASNNNNAGNFSLPGTNTRVATVSGRKYLEQSGIQASGTFTGKWTAPPINTGDVKFYFIGNAVNGNSQDTGDKATAAISQTYTEACSPTAATQNRSICAGGSLIVGTHTHSTAGTFLDTLVNARGCDSVVTTNLSVTPAIQSNQNRTICQGASFSVGVHTYTTAGLYHDTLSTPLGCDSIVNTTLMVTPALQSTQNRQICPGQTVTVGIHVYSIIGIFHDTLHTALGCDSIVTTNISNSPAIQFSQSLQICSGGGALVGTHFYTAQGTYIDTLIASTGCDSIITSHIAVVPAVHVTQNIGVCPGGSLTVGTHVYSIAGTYEDTLTAVGNCDSIISTTLFIHSVPFVQFADSVCQGSTYNFGGSLLNTAGVYRDTVVSSVGCDSIVELTLSVNAVPNVNFVNQDTSICDFSLPYSFSLNATPAGGVFSGANVSGNTFNAALGLNPGMYPVVYNYTNAHGCSARDTLQVEIIVCFATAPDVLSGVTVSPNPAREYFSVSGIMPGAHLEVFDLNGKRVMQSFSGGFYEHIHLDEKPGIYLLKITQGNAVAVKRVLWLGM